MKKILSFSNWNLSVDLEGGRIEELTYKNNLILGTFKRGDGKLGNTHLCVPNFGAEGMEEYGLPFHGPSRNTLWQLEHETEDSLTIICKLPQTEKYAAELYVAQVFTVEKEFFKHEITVEHGGGEAVPVNIGIHNYWVTPEGWEGAKLNGEDITEKTKKNQHSKLRRSNTITLPGDRRIKLKVKGFEDVMFWSSKGGASYDSEYICIEPVCILETGEKATKNKLLREGNQRVLTQEISIM